MPWRLPALRWRHSRKYMCRGSRRHHLCRVQRWHDANIRRQVCQMWWQRQGSFCCSCHRWNAHARLHVPSHRHTEPSNAEPCPAPLCHCCRTAHHGDSAAGCGRYAFRRLGGTHQIFHEAPRVAHIQRGGHSSQLRELTRTCGALQHEGLHHFHYDCNHACHPHILRDLPPQGSIQGADAFLGWRSWHALHGLLHCGHFHGVGASAVPGASQ
mmetsp:Transcript_40084/g.94356  ORF Transcript_40084/g.94356 Transcript_40084/m.94356 type:complete len:212 (-) Transcript_40084:1805-2440(-)